MNFNLKFQFEIHLVKNILLHGNFVYRFSLCGFGTSITFKHVDDAAIDYVEDFVRTELSQILSDRKLCGEQLEEIDLFGRMLIHNKGAFKFLLGERKLIKELSDFTLKKFTKVKKLFSVPNISNLL